MITNQLTFYLNVYFVGVTCQELVVKSHRDDFEDVRGLLYCLLEFNALEHITNEDTHLPLTEFIHT